MISSGGISRCAKCNYVDENSFEINGAPTDPDIENGVILYIDTGKDDEYVA